MKFFKRFYVWGMNAKLFMSIYFVAMAFLTGITIAFSGGESVKLLTLLQMLLVCMAIAVLQCVLLDDKTDYSKGIFFMRSVIWLAASTVLTVGAALLFGWFAGLLPACPWILGAFMLCGLSASLFGLKCEQDADSVKLNAHLKAFKENAKG